MNGSLPVELERPDGTKTGLIMDVGTPEEADEVFEFLVQHFFSVPPLRQLYLISEHSTEKFLRPAFEMINVRKSLSRPLSIIIRCQDQIVGVMLAELIDKDAALQQQSTEPSSEKSTGWLMKALIAELNRGVDLFSRYKTSKIAYIHTCAIRADHVCSGLSLGLAPAMGSLVSKLAWKNGARAVKAEAFTASSARASMIGYFETLRSIDLANFEMDGIKPLANVLSELGDNRIARLMVLPLISNVNPKCNL